jgi:DNA adenine methylase
VTEQYYSPLRYPGGKASLFDFLVRAIESNNINYGVYVEGFAGGAGAALKLLMLEHVSDIYLNDKDEFIYKFWRSVLYQTDELCNLIQDSQLTIEEWQYRHDILFNTNNYGSLSELEIGFTCFYLNRCNRSGILSGGPIGGIEQSGIWKIDARYNKDALIKRIQKIALYADRIHLSNLDVVDFLKGFQIHKYKHSEVIHYLDPPYVKQGEQLYMHSFKELDHQRLAIYLQTQESYKWLVSYDDTPLIHQIYKEVTKNIFEFNYFVNRTKVGRELIISSKHFSLPITYNHYSKTKLLALSEPSLLLEDIQRVASN